MIARTPPAHATRGVVAVCVALLAIFSGAATGASPVTYVATYGVDSATCSLVQSCRSFAGALAQTSDGGQIVVLDSGGYGPVQIDKSVSIIAPEGVYAGISVFSGKGVEITGAATHVKLSGLTIVTSGGSTDLYGVYASVPVDLSIEQVVISGFSNSSVGMVLCSPQDCIIPGAGTLRVVDSMTYSNGTGINAGTLWKAVIERSLFVGDNVGANAAVADSLFAFGGGLGLIAFGTTGGGGSVRRSVFSDNPYQGVFALGWGSVPVQVSLSRNVFARNREGVAIGTGLGGASAIDIDSCVFTDNQRYGIDHTSNDPAANVTLTNNTIARNALGGVLNQFGALIHSRVNNTVRNNGVDGGPFVPLPGL